MIGAVGSVRIRVAEGKKFLWFDTLTPEGFLMTTCSWAPDGDGMMTADGEVGLASVVGF